MLVLFQSFSVVFKGTVHTSFSICSLQLAQLPLCILHYNKLEGWLGHSGSTKHNLNLSTFAYLSVTHDKTVINM